MIIAHALVGLMPVADSKFSLFWFLGSVTPDVDHLFVIYRHRLFSLKHLIEVERYEDKYNIHFKTKYTHSVFGAVLFSIPVFLINRSGGVYFITAYLLHLLLDWPDRDEKRYLYPLKIKFRGWLPILSKWEILFTLALIICLFKMYF